MESPFNNNQRWESGRYRKVDVNKVPFGAWLLSRAGSFNFYPEYSYKLYILFLTFCCYAAYHMSRKPFSVVAHVLAPNCTLSSHGDDNTTNNTYEDYNDYHNNIYNRAVDPNDYIDGWPPFNGKRCKTIIGAVDYAWLFTYAVFLVISGVIADRVSLRYFLTIGMIGSGVFVGLLGVAYYAEIHHLSYFIIVQIFVGIFESTGWPGVVSIMGNWLGIKRRGLVMGIWNSHTSVGNILGTAVPAIWAVKGKPWSWSFFVPGFVMIFVAFIIFFFIIVDPSHVGLPPPIHHREPSSPSSSSQQSSVIGSISKNKGRKGYYDDTKGLLSSEDESLPLDNKTPPPFYDDYNSQRDHEETKLIEGEPSGIDNHESVPQSPTQPKPKKQAIGLIGALKVPGVIEFSLALFFAKLVAYTFLFWLPYYITYHKIEGRHLGEKKSNLLSTLYDVGGIIGGIITGGLSDLINARAISCVIMMYLAVPTLFLYRYLGPESIPLSIFLIIMCGLFINGPYALITTAVSSDLGTHKSLKENQKAKATVGAIIDSMGSFGAACGPLIAGWVSDDFGWNSVFYVLMFSCFFSSLMLSRLLFAECRRFYKQFRDYRDKRNRRYSPNTFDSSYKNSIFK